MSPKLEVLTRINPQPAKTAVVLLHGYGADCEDLAGLQGYLDPGLSSDWYFPNGIYPVEQFMGMGRCWFQLSVSRWLEHTGNQDFAAIYDAVPEDFGQAHQAVLEFVQGLSQTYSTIALGGFSQGAMLTVQLLPYLDPKTYNRILLFSGALINRPALLAQLTSGAPDGQSQRDGQSILQSHGRQDMVLPYKMGEDLKEQLNQHFPQHSFIPFDGGHEIPMPVLSAAKSFLGLS